MYDEFGNYIGPNILSDEEVEEDADSVAEEPEEKEDHSHAMQLLEKTDEAFSVRFFSWTALASVLPKLTQVFCVI